MSSNVFAQDLTDYQDGVYQMTIEDGKIVEAERLSGKESETAIVGSGVAEACDVNLEDGEYSIELSMSGGSGKASIESPTLLIVKDGKAYADLKWSSPNYDYMIVDGEKFLNESEEGINSEYHVPVTCFDSEMNVIADTTAMGTPHEVSYSLTFFSESIGSKSALPQEAAKKVIMIAMIIIVGGGILNHYVNKKNRV